MASFAKLISSIKKEDSENPAVAIERLFSSNVAAPFTSSKRLRIKAAYDLLEAADADDFEKMHAAYMEVYRVYSTMHPRLKGVFHFSALVDSCERAMWYEIFEPGAERNATAGFSPQTMAIFDLGTWFHLYAQIILKHAGILEQAEVPVVDVKRKISSRCDGIIKWSSERLMLEIKTMNSNQYRKGIHAPFEKHKKQAGLYATELKLSGTIFLYFNKDTSEYKFHFWKVEPTLIAPLYEKMADVLTVKKPPVRIDGCDSKSSVCATKCPYRNHCWK